MEYAKLNNVSDINHIPTSKPTIIQLSHYRPEQALRASGG
jgi:hypothetical protein